MGIQVLWISTRHIDTITDSEDGKRIKAIVSGRESNSKFIEPMRGSDNRYFGLGRAEWDQIEVLHPASSHKSDSSNQGSYLLKILYGKSSLIIGGDNP